MGGRTNFSTFFSLSHQRKASHLSLPALYQICHYYYYYYYYCYFIPSTLSACFTGNSTNIWRSIRFLFCDRTKAKKRLKKCLQKLESLIYFVLRFLNSTLSFFVVHYFTGLTSPYSHCSDFFFHVIFEQIQCQTNTFRSAL